MNKLLQFVLAVAILLGAGAFIYSELHHCPDYLPPIPVVNTVTVTAPVDSNKIISDARYGYVVNNVDSLKALYGDKVIVYVDSSKNDSIPAIFTDDTIEVAIDSLGLTMDAHIEVTTLLLDEPKSLIDLTLMNIRQTKNDTIAFVFEPVESYYGYDEWYKNYPQSIILGSCGATVVIVGGIVLANTLANIGG